MQIFDDVVGHRDQMREIRAGSTYVLTLLTFLLQIEPFLKTFKSTVHIHTRSQGLINKVLERHINKPSLVTSNHARLRIKVFFIHTHVTPKEIDDDTTNKAKTNESQLKKLK